MNILPTIVGNKEERENFFLKNSSSHIANKIKTESKNISTYFMTMRLGIVKRLHPHKVIK